MGILEVLGGSTAVNLNAEDLEDFPSGLRIVEIVDGKEKTDDAITLAGSFMPHGAFEFGGTQQIVKKFYPGNSDPSVQMLGARESDQTIKGKLKEKYLDRELAGSAEAYQEALDAMRIRGNVVRIMLGEWKRYGVIEEVKFGLIRRNEIDYEIRFSIIGFRPPTDCKFVDEDTDPLRINRELIAAALEALQNAQRYPDSMPQSLADQINSAISGVASVVSTVTGFVDSVVNDALALQNSANRALGMLKYARAYISRTNRQIGSISIAFYSLGSQFNSEAQKTSAYIRNLKFITEVKATNQSLASQLAAMQKKFANLARTIPMVRHLVAEGDSLQKLSVKYYGSADNWERILVHNKLESTALVKGTVLEIPKL